MVENSYNKILVPFDDSKFSRRALQTAIIFAKAYRSTLYLAIVVYASSVAPPGLIRSQATRKTFDQIRTSIRRSVETILEKIEREYSEEGINVKTIVTDGLVSDELLKLIEKNNIDLVIIGSQGLSGFSKLKALGSVSRKISESAKCPVMIVR